MENYSNSMPQVAGPVDPAYHAAKAQRTTGTLDRARTFDGIRDALSRVRSISSVAEGMLDRVSPQVSCIANESNAKAPPPLTYSHALTSLHEELSTLAATMEALDSHI